MILEEQAAYVKEAARSQVAITLPINLDSPTLDSSLTWENEVWISNTK